MRKRWRRRIEQLERPHGHDPYNLAVPFRLPPYRTHMELEPAPIHYTALPAPNHYTTLAEVYEEGESKGWRAQCACGWRGPIVPTELDATESANDHWDEVWPLG